MKREIKFRAWDGLEMISMATNESLDSFFLHVTIKADIFDKKCELMQFTGLQDKNGKEIYEGDICQAMQGEQQKPKSFYLVKSKVIFWKGSFEFFGKSLNNINTEDNGYAKSIMWCWHGYNNLPDIYEEINSIEVIGNIFENPELLNQ